MKLETLELPLFDEEHPMYQAVQTIAAIMSQEATIGHVSENEGGKLAEKFYDENFAGKLPPYDLLVAAGVLITCVLDNLKTLNNNSEVGARN